MVLENQTLRVELHDALPVVRSYLHKPTGETFGGDPKPRPLLFNGREVPWSDLRIDGRPAESGAEFSVQFGEIAFDYRIALEDACLRIRIDNVRGPLETLGFGGAPVLSVADPAYRYARITTTDPNEGGKRWWREQFGRVLDAAAECDVMHGCVYHTEKLCAFVHSNYPLLPEHHRHDASGYRISLADYRYRVRTRTMWPLDVRVVFLQDYNGDGVIDWSDFALWVNRTLPDAEEFYRKTIAYKIFLTWKQGPVVTTYEQASEIVRALHNVTDGLPQLVYMPGWQFQGHDDKYPSVNQVNPRPGGRYRLEKMVRECAERYNTLVSYHVNVDDAYPDSPDWDPSYMTSAEWEPSDSGKAFGVVHTLDWERGHFARRMHGMFSTVPVSKTLHVDNTRICNTYGREVDGIGELEELFCGLLPMADWLKERGITLTTEGTNGMPIDGALLFSGWFHYDCGLLGRQILHRKLVGGGPGRHFGELTAKDYALGSNIHVDFGHARQEFIVSFLEDFRGMVDRVFLGSILYLYFLERELTVCRVLGPEQIHMEYSDGTVVDITSAHTMTVTSGDMTIAKDNDTRCVPLDDALYIYSTVGDRQTFMLPPEWRGRKIDMVMLTKDGPEIHDILPAEWHYRILDDRIEFHWMPPYMPYKVTLA